MTTFSLGKYLNNIELYVQHKLEVSMNSRPSFPSPTALPPPNLLVYFQQFLSAFNTLLVLLISFLGKWG